MPEKFSDDVQKATEDALDRHVEVHILFQIISMSLVSLALASSSLSEPDEILVELRLCFDSVIKDILASSEIMQDLRVSTHNHRK